MAAANLLEAYGDLVARRPFVTQMCTAGILSTSADIIAQQLLERKKSHDFRRTLIMAFCGFFYFGLLISLWYMLLSKSTLSTLANVFLDQFVATPPLLAGFLVLQSLLLRQGMREITRRVKNEYLSILKANWMVWIPTQLVNFQFVPFQYRMLFSQVIALFWNCYICVKTNRGSRKTSEAVVSPVREKKEPAT